MAAVGFGEGTRYGIRLYAYVLATFALGSLGVGLGVALLYPELEAWRGPGQATVAPGVAGGLLTFLGLSVLTIGWIGTAYKLLADGVAAGRRAGVGDPTEPLDPDPTERRSAGSTTDRGDDRSAEPGDALEDHPPEPSPSEIAFGDDAPDAAEGSLPGRDSSGDPLGERTE